MNNIDVINYGNRLLKSSNICSYNLDSELILAKELNKGLDAPELL